LATFFWGVVKQRSNQWMRDSLMIYAGFALNMPFLLPETGVDKIKTENFLFLSFYFALRFETIGYFF